MFTRYAIFYTPADGEFAAFGARWLGWDSATGRPVAHLTCPGIDVAAVTATPRKYGFHGTLKAPFRLAHGWDEADLKAAVAAFAARQARVEVGRYVLRLDHGFVALRPAEQTPELRRLAEDIVRRFDPFRAPLEPDDIARRRRAKLTERQDRQMLDWGYPFVFEDFHFHMTLTGQLGAPTGTAVLQALSPLVQPLIARPARIEALTLMGESKQGFFHQIQRSVFNG